MGQRSNGPRRSGTTAFRRVEIRTLFMKRLILHCLNDQIREIDGTRGCDPARIKAIGSDAEFLTIWRHILAEYQAIVKYAPLKLGKTRQGHA